MYPVLFHWGLHPVASYTVVMAGTLALAFGWLARQQRRGRDGALDIGWLAVIVGIAGARLVYVWVNSEYYSERWLRVLDLRDGGLSWYGGLLAGLLALLVLGWPNEGPRPEPSLARLQRRLELLTTPLAIGILGGWLACLLAGCAYGLAIDPPQRFYTPDWPDNFGVLAFRLPSQAFGLLLGLLLLARPLRRHPGLWLIVLGLGQFGIGWTRGDLTLTWGPLHASQWLDLGIVLFGLVLVARSRRSAAQPASQ
ncbi:MAG: prolipoprotein diacylglyceryl transferase family protein [Anaerolineae bacterium]